MKTSTNYRWTFSPYCIQRLGPNRVVILNRDYAPLGMRRDISRDWKKHAVGMRWPPPAQAAKLDWDGRDGKNGSIYLYNEACAPYERSTQATEAYEERIARLSRRKMWVE